MQQINEKEAEDDESGRTGFDVTCHHVTAANFSCSQRNFGVDWKSTMAVALGLGCIGIVLVSVLCNHRNRLNLLEKDIKGLQQTFSKGGRNF